MIEQKWFLKRNAKDKYIYLNKVIQILYMIVALDS